MSAEIGHVESYLAPEARGDIPSLSSALAPTGV
jgi:hypothetical protein